MPLVGEFSWESPVSPALLFRRCSILASISPIGSQDLAVENRPKIFTHSSLAPTPELKVGEKRKIPEKTPDQRNRWYDSQLRKSGRPWPDSCWPWSAGHSHCTSLKASVSSPLSYQALTAQLPQTTGAAGRPQPRSPTEGLYLNLNCNRRHSTPLLIFIKTLNLVADENEVKRGENVTTPCCKVRGNGRSPKKPDDQRHHSARFLHVNIRGWQPRWESTLLYFVYIVVKPYLILRSGESHDDRYRRLMYDELRRSAQQAYCDSHLGPASRGENTSSFALHFPHTGYLMAPAIVLKRRRELTRNTLTPMQYLGFEPRTSRTTDRQRTNRLRHGRSGRCADLLWRSRLVRHRSRVRKALGPNPGHCWWWGMAAPHSKCSRLLLDQAVPRPVKALDTQVKVLSLRKSPAQYLQDVSDFQSPAVCPHLSRTELYPGRSMLKLWNWEGHSLRIHSNMQDYPGIQPTLAVLIGSFIRRQLGYSMTLTAVLPDTRTSSDPETSLLRSTPKKGPLYLRDHSRKMLSWILHTDHGRFLPGKRPTQTSTKRGRRCVPARSFDKTTRQRERERERERVARKVLRIPTRVARTHTHAHMPGTTPPNVASHSAACDVTAVVFSSRYRHNNTAQRHTCFLVFCNRLLSAPSLGASLTAPSDVYHWLSHRSQPTTPHGQTMAGQFITTVVKCRGDGALDVSFIAALIAISSIGGVRRARRQHDCTLAQCEPWLQQCVGHMVMAEGIQASSQHSALCRRAAPLRDKARRCDWRATVLRGVWGRQISAILHVAPRTKPILPRRSRVCRRPFPAARRVAVDQIYGSTPPEAMLSRNREPKFPVVYQQQVITIVERCRTCRPSSALSCVTRKRRLGTGPRNVTTARDDRHLVRMAVTDRTASFTMLARHWSTATGVDLSASTVRHCLLRDGLVARMPLRRLPLSRNHKRLRLQWQNLVFPDESRFNMSYSDGRIRVRHYRGDRNMAACFVERHRGQTPSVMFWGANRYNIRNRYIREVLGPEVLPVVQATPHVIFQQDNARPHVARDVQAFFSERRVPMLPCPARSPDMSPIEHVWDMVGRRLVRHGPPATTVDALWTLIQTAWT
ncbi:hypothetical protein PR048_006027 [Dryococelus australis]|uniref:Transposase Tc1-like domain-containing protein n=1 Tax=Dryococelus australis TaxID=614101 RepID=A0ABQ9I9U8_9NEOP|nr:hypothetical protein PR048_006027 [Dryococelus australis]